MVDHRIAPKGDQTLFWDRSNWQPFASVCNTRKAIASEGGFGRPIDAKAGGGGRVETSREGPPTAWGQSRDISAKSDHGTKKP